MSLVLDREVDVPSGELCDLDVFQEVQRQGGRCFILRAL